MRNRGIEIFLLPEQAEQEAAPAPAAAAALQGPAAAEQQQQQQAEHADLQQVLALAGVPGTALPAAMASAHAAVAAHAAQRHRRPPGLRELRRWAALAGALAGRGWRPAAALHTAWCQLYVRSEAAAAAGADEAAGVARAAYEACMQPLLARGGCSTDLVLHRPAAWPLPLGVAAFAGDSATACTARDAALLLHHLALLVSADLRQQSASGGGTAGGVLTSRAAWVQELGVAAAAAMPAGALLRLLAGRRTNGTTSSESGAAGEAALLAAPAAARVFAERCGPGQRGGRAAHAAALSGQLQQLLAAAGIAGGQGLLAVQQAERVVSTVLAHPLAAAAGELQQQLAAAVRLPEASRAFLPLDAAAAEPPLFLLSADLPAGQQAALGRADAPDSVSAVAELWRRVQEVGSKMAQLWQAVQCAAVLHSAAEGGDGAVAGGDATLLQLSAWRHHRPKVGSLLGGVRVVYNLVGRRQQPHFVQASHPACQAARPLPPTPRTRAPPLRLPPLPCRSAPARRRSTPPSTGGTPRWRLCRRWRRRCWCRRRQRAQRRVAPSGRPPWPTRWARRQGVG